MSSAATKLLAAKQKLDVGKEGINSSSTFKINED